MESESNNEANTSGPQTAKLLQNFIKSPTAACALELLTGSHTLSQSDLDDALISACQQGHKFLALVLIDLGADVDAKDVNGNTPLMLCARKGFTDMAHCFISRGADINETNSMGDTPLILSIQPTGSTEMTKLILEQDRLNLYHKNQNGDTALMKAVEAMDIDVIKLLLDKESSMLKEVDNHLSSNKKEAQQIADKLGIGKVVELLIKCKQSDVTPLVAAIQASDIESFNVFIDCQFSDTYDKSRSIQNAFEDIFRTHKNNCQDFKESEIRIVKKLLECGATINQNHYGYDPVTVAIEVGSYSMVELLCEQGADLEALSRSRHTDTLKLAAKTGRCDLIDLLIKYKAKVSQNNFSDSALDCALKHGHVDCAKLLIKHGAHMDIKQAMKSAVDQQLPPYVKFLVENLRDEVRMTLSTQDFSDLLVSASRHGNLEIIGLLLDAGADINRANSNAKTPLMESKNAEVVRFLVKRGAVINKWRRYRTGQFSPLTYILSKEYLYDSARAEVIQALLENGAVVNGRSCGGNTPLMLAVRHRRSKEIIQMLLDHGADVNEKDGKGNTTLIVAAEQNSAENVTCLLQVIKGRKDFINMQNYKGSTALMVASENCKLQIVKELIDNGADVNITDTEGNTALLLSMSRSCCEDAQVLKLLENGAVVNGRSCGGNTPLLLALRYSRSKEVIQMLLDHGADVSEKDGNDNTTLIVAAQENSAKNVTCLLQVIKGRKDFINMQNSEGSTALMAASKNCNLQIVKELIDNGADVNITDTEGNTALLHVMSRIYSTDTQILTILIDAGSNVNCQNKSGLSPLMLAAKKHKKEILSVLVDSGADVNLVSKSSENKTALSFLLEYSCFDNDLLSCIEYLLDKGASSSYVSHSFLHNLIITDKRMLVFKLVQRGLGPADARSSEISGLSVYGDLKKVPVSPLYVSLVAGNVALARYFLGNLFLTNSDVSSLACDQAIRGHLQRLKYRGCLDILDVMSAQPMSLFKLGFVAVSSAIGARPGRETRVNLLPVPQVIKDRLMFQKGDVLLDLTVACERRTTTLPSFHTSSLLSFRNRFSWVNDYDDLI